LPQGATKVATQVAVLLAHHLVEALVGDVQFASFQDFAVAGAGAPRRVLRALLPLCFLTAKR
jgi:hypothetical protein